MRDLSPRFVAHRGPWLLAVAGASAALIATAASPDDARRAAEQTWSPFVLVAGLLLIGLVAEEDGVFRVAGAWVSRAARHRMALFGGGCLLVVVVTATLNLDTAVVFLTPILVAAARGHGMNERALLYASLLLANASSLFLPGSNLTNLIVFGHHPVSGSAFFALMWPAAVVSSAVTAACVGFWSRRDLRAPGADDLLSAPPAVPVVLRGAGTSVLAVAAAVAVVLAVRAPALPVLGIGVAAAGLRMSRARLAPRRAVDILGAPVLVGLFGVTVGLGALGRAWDGPATLLAHAGGVGASALAAAGTVVVNNLPAASLLAARHPAHAAQVLVGLNLGPNLGVTGSLAWFLWLRAARASGAAPSVRTASRIGVVVVPLSIAAALGALALAGSG